jgi:hypothetical protein
MIDTTNLIQAIQDRIARLKCARRHRAAWRSPRPDDGALLERAEVALSIQQSNLEALKRALCGRFDKIRSLEEGLKAAKMDVNFLHRRDRTLREEHQRDTAALRAQNESLRAELMKCSQLEPPAPIIVVHNGPHAGTYTGRMEDFRPLTHEQMASGLRASVGGVNAGAAQLRDAGADVEFGWSSTVDGKSLLNVRIKKEI